MDPRSVLFAGAEAVGLPQGRMLSTQSSRGISFHRLTNGSPMATLACARPDPEWPPPQGKIFFHLRRACGAPARAGEEADVLFSRAGGALGEEAETGRSFTKLKNTPLVFSTMQKAVEMRLINPI